MQTRHLQLLQLAGSTKLGPLRVTFLTKPRQGDPSFVDMVSARLNRITVADDRAKPAFSNLAHARTPAINTTDAAAKAKHASSVRRNYILISHKGVSHMSALPFNASINKADDGKLLVYSSTTAASGILIRCVNHCTEALRSPDWVPD